MNGYGPTPTPKKLRRRIDGSPIVSRDTTLPPKRIFLIRHGESMGQTAKRLGWDRKTDRRLIDCGLTSKGTSQAYSIRKLLGEKMDLESIELVVSSPLTRALHTALLAFPDKSVLVGYDLREIGSKVPENTPRKIEQVLSDATDMLATRQNQTVVDVDTLRPPDWPRDYSPSVVKRDRLRKFFQFLYQSRSETTIAVVCHYNVIRSAVMDGATLRPANAVPIACQLYPNGDVELLGSPDDANMLAEPDPFLHVQQINDPQNEFSSAAAYYTIFRKGRIQEQACSSQQTRDFWTEDVWTMEDEEMAQETLQSHLEKCTIPTNHISSSNNDGHAGDYDANAWDQFYTDHGTRFFKDRHYLEKTFPEEFVQPFIDESTNTDVQHKSISKSARTLVEIGCGVGNAILPLTEPDNDGRRWDVIHGLDISQQAIQLLQQDERFIAFNKSGATKSPRQAIFGHVCDISRDLPRCCNGISDVTTLLFCLSAIDPSFMPNAVKNVASTLKPGGRLVFRDYGRYDEAQMKLGTSRSKRIKDNFYQKHDGTKCYYFTLEEVTHLFGSIAGLEIVEVKYLRRLYTNKGTGQRRRRVWVQGRFQQSQAQT
ncbi:methyltransferase domain containing protein [Nitzschia inconspicua]|uniref:Methyltransferase domain containing protein n=1 Tax=Nitzschia inconspicua TaxID=303405 RepID=A0A9K3LHB6_9STRA|nr:methyltransferase domain containing protein [Nitzschia inconspicua]